MSKTLKEMKSTLRMSVITQGDRFERGIAENILNQGIAHIEKLEAALERLGNPVSEISFVTEGALIWTAANELQSRIEYARKALEDK